METSSKTFKESKKPMMKSFYKNKPTSKNTRNPHIKDDKYSSKMIQKGPNININEYSYFIDGFLYM